MHYLHLIFVEVVPFIATLIEIIGIIVIIIAVINSFIKLVFSERFNLILAEKDLVLTSGLSTALEFFLAAEILKTLVTKSYQELIQLAALVAIRIIMSLIIHWEIKQKESHCHSEEEKSHIYVHKD